MYPLLLFGFHVQQGPPWILSQLITILNHNSRKTLYLVMGVLMRK